MRLNGGQGKKRRPPTVAGPDWPHASDSRIRLDEASRSAAALSQPRRAR